MLFSISFGLQSLWTLFSFSLFLLFLFILFVSSGCATSLQPCVPFMRIRKTSLFYKTLLKSTWAKKMTTWRSLLSFKRLLTAAWWCLEQTANVTTPQTPTYGMHSAIWASQVNYFSATISGWPKKKSDRNWKLQSWKRQHLREAFFVFLAARIAILKSSLAGLLYSSEKKIRAEILSEENYRRDCSSSQRVGYDVQLIIKAWDLVANSLAFPPAEGMMMPYSLFSIKKVVLKLRLHKRRATHQDRKRNIQSLLMLGLPFQKGLQRMLKREAILVNAMLCKLTSYFLYDIRTQILSEKLFPRLDGKWGFAEAFAGDKKHLPAHFCNVDGVLHGAMTEPGGGEEGLVFCQTQAPQNDHVLSSPQSDLEFSAAEGPRRKIRRMNYGNETNTVAAASNRRRARYAEGRIYHKAKRNVQIFMQQSIQRLNCCFTEVSTEEAQSRPGVTVDISKNVQLVLLIVSFNIRRGKVPFNSDQPLTLTWYTGFLRRPRKAFSWLCSTAAVV